jgi:hypothetical protein
MSYHTGVTDAPERLVVPSLAPSDDFKFNPFILSDRRPTKEGGYSQKYREWRCCGQLADAKGCWTDGPFGPILYNFAPALRSGDRNVPWMEDIQKGTAWRDYRYYEKRHQQIQELKRSIDMDPFRLNPRKWKGQHIDTIIILYQMEYDYNLPQDPKPLEPKTRQEWIDFVKKEWFTVPLRTAPLRTNRMNGIIQDIITIEQDITDLTNAAKGTNAKDAAIEAKFKEWAQKLEELRPYNIINMPDMLATYNTKVMSFNDGKWNQNVVDAIISAIDTELAKLAPLNNVKITKLFTDWNNAIILLRRPKGEKKRYKLKYQAYQNLLNTPLPPPPRGQLSPEDIQQIEVFKQSFNFKDWKSFLDALKLRGVDIKQLEDERSQLLLKYEERKKNFRDEIAALKLDMTKAVSLAVLTTLNTNAQLLLDAFKGVLEDAIIQEQFEALKKSFNNNAKKLELLELKVAVDAAAKKLNGSDITQLINNHNLFIVAVSAYETYLNGLKPSKFINTTSINNLKDKLTAKKAEVRDGFLRGRIPPGLNRYVQGYFTNDFIEHIGFKDTIVTRMTAWDIAEKRVNASKDGAKLDLFFLYISELEKETSLNFEEQAEKVNTHLTLDIPNFKTNPKDAIQLKWAFGGNSCWADASLISIFSPFMGNYLIKKIANMPISSIKLQSKDCNKLEYYNALIHDINCIRNGVAQPSKLRSIWNNICVKGGVLDVCKDDIVFPFIKALDTMFNLNIGTYVTEPKNIDLVSIQGKEFLYFEIDSLQKTEMPFVLPIDVRFRRVSIIYSKNKRHFVSIIVDEPGKKNYYVNAQNYILETDTPVTVFSEVEAPNEYGDFKFDMILEKDQQTLERVNVPTTDPDPVYFPVGALYQRSDVFVNGKIIPSDLFQDPQRWAALQYALKNWDNIGKRIAGLSRAQL